MTIEKEGFWEEVERATRFDRTGFVPAISGVFVAGAALGVALRRASMLLRTDK